MLDQLVVLDMKHGVEAKNYEEVCPWLLALQALLSQHSCDAICRSGAHEGEAVFPAVMKACLQATIPARLCVLVEKKKDKHQLKLVLYSGK